ncbi:Cytochrome c oxidase subunit Vc family protein [Prunus dulcis]|uniref:Cytochrome c oxidase subunit Vc family protein n=1 Tax=Prunus dulcis TaxID=3755 RepID=A0A4Y1RI55_PRUDU|nr:Cytochrome c oxidase subunit Vc family protein [Prunus dulcis]
MYHLQPTEFDNIGHIVGSSTSKGDGVVETQESIAMQLYKEYEIGHMAHPILHENHFLDHQYQYWNEDYNIHMPSFSSGGSDILLLVFHKHLNTKRTKRCQGDMLWHGACFGYWKLWKMHHWNEQRKVRVFHDLLEKGEISVVARE